MRWIFMLGRSMSHNLSTFGAATLLVYLITWMAIVVREKFYEFEIKVGSIGQGRPTLKGSEAVGLAVPGQFSSPKNETRVRGWRLFGVLWAGI